jgi:uncharacterized protein (TIGR02996 family)
MDEAAFLQRILDDLAGAAQTWLVLADWLEEHGDLRHELIRFQHDPRYRTDLSPAERDEQVCALLRGGVKPPLPTVTNSIGMRFVLVSSDTFLMGSPETEEERTDDEGPQHAVEITRPFLLGVHAVTQEEYERVMGSNSSHFAPQGKGKRKAKAEAKCFPVESVSWDDAVAFCERLSELPEEVAAGRTYRLPCEAEWEYACRGGRLFQHLSAPFYFSESTFALDATLANFNGNHPYGGGEKGPYLQRPTPVGSYPANPLGLHDLHGNVWEWCCDWFGKDFYADPKAGKDPTGPTTGTSRVLRGGSWDSFGWYCRAAFRGNLDPPRPPQLHRVPRRSRPQDSVTLWLFYSFTLLLAAKRRKKIGKWTRASRLLPPHRSVVFQRQQE